MMEEAAKARDYSCEALYLDPGWDTDAGTFLWGEEWLGDRRQFIQGSLGAMWSSGIIACSPGVMDVARGRQKNLC